MPPIDSTRSPMLTQAEPFAPHGIDVEPHAVIDDGEGELALAPFKCMTLPALALCLTAFCSAS